MTVNVHDSESKKKKFTGSYKCYSILNFHTPFYYVYCMIIRSDSMFNFSLIYYNFQLKFYHFLKHDIFLLQLLLFWS